MLLKEVVFVYAIVVIRCINNVERSGTKFFEGIFTRLINLSPLTK